MYRQLIFLLIFYHYPLISTAAICGNGIIEAGQQCDDSNTNNNDGCSSTCQIQADFSCTSAPSICKINIVVHLSYLGNYRNTNKNTVTFIFTFSQHYSQFCKVDLQTIISTDILYNSLSVTYDCDQFILLLTIDFAQNLENMVRKFQILFSSTAYFWSDSSIYMSQLKGLNCQLSYQDDIELHVILTYVMYVIVGVTIIVGFYSISRQKWIGLQLIHTYQSVYFIFFLLGDYPYELKKLIQSISYSTGFDKIVPVDIMRIYKLSTQLNGLDLEKEFLVNFNVSLGIIMCIVIILVILSLRRTYLKHRLESQINHKINKELQKLNKIFTFLFGQIFIMVVLVFMLKIITMFIIELNKQDVASKVFPNQVSVTLSTISFILLFMVITFIANWYAVIPDNLTENDCFHSLQFRNMKFHYPIIYITYEALIIFIISILYARSFTIEVVLAVQILYLLFILWIWPYNTPRKINRILHNLTILFNQMTEIFATIVVMRWRILLPGEQSSKSNYEALAYFFIIFILLVTSLVLAIIRLAIFNKDVDCCQRDMEIEQNERPIQLKALNQTMIQSQSRIQIDDNHRFVDEPVLNRKKKQKMQENFVNEGDSIDRYLNSKYIIWAKENNSIPIKKTNRNIPKTNPDKKAELIKTPFEIYKQFRKKYNEVSDF